MRPVGRIPLTTLCGTLRGASGFSACAAVSLICKNSRWETRTLPELRARVIRGVPRNSASGTGWWPATASGRSSARIVREEVDDGPDRLEVEQGGASPRLRALLRQMRAEECPACPTGLEVGSCDPRRGARVLSRSRDGQHAGALEPLLAGKDRRALGAAVRVALSRPARAGGG